MASCHVVWSVSSEEKYVFYIVLLKVPPGNFRLLWGSVYRIRCSLTLRKVWCLFPWSSEHSFTKSPFLFILPHKRLWEIFFHPKVIWTWVSGLSASNGTYLNRLARCSVFAISSIAFPVAWFRLLRECKCTRLET